MNVASFNKNGITFPLPSEIQDIEDLVQKCSIKIFYVEMICNIDLFLGILFMDIDLLSLM